MDNLKFVFVKSCDIVFTSILYFVICTLISFSLEFIWAYQTPGFIDKTSIGGLYLYLMFHMVLLSLLFYAARNIVHAIKSPFDKALGTDYVHSRLKEVDGGIMAGFTLFLLCPTLYDMSHIIRVRLWSLSPL